MSTPRSTRRRLAVTVLAILGVLSLFVGRLVDIQLVHAAEYNAESLNKRAQVTTTYGVRGDILDSNGVVLADSVERFNITASPQVVAEFKRVVDDETVTVSVVQAVNELAEITGDDPAVIFDAITKDPEANFAYVSKSVDLAALRAVRDLDIPWVWDELQPSRTYPNGSVAGNLTGFLSKDGPGAGVELTHNDCLQSTNGTSVYERGADGVRIPGSTVTTTEAKDGGDITLTIDSDLQWYVQQVIAERAQELGAEWATAMVVRVTDGHIMAAADYPSVDPNNVDGVPVTALGSLAFSSPYEPGSTMKSLTVAALLDAGLVTQGTQITAPGRIELPNGSYIKDAWAHGDIRYTTAGALANSSNTGISLLVDRMSREERREYMLKFGLNEKTEVGFNGEANGDVPVVENWDPVTNYAVQFGQGLTMTSAQVASIYQTLGNGGVRMPLTLVAGCTWPDGTVTEVPSAEGTRAVSEIAADQTVEILESVASTGGLSGYLAVPGYRIAAKSGTAEVAEGGVYGGERIISIAGVLPAEDPQYAVVVTFGKPDTIRTSSAAASTFKKITTQIIKSFRIEPSTVPAPSIPLEW